MTERGVINFGYVTLTRSLVAGNTAGRGAQEISNERSPDAITADNFNLFGHSGIDNATAISGFTPGLTDITATSDGTQPTALTAILDTVLKPNGGPTQTHNLVPGSPAVDAAGASCGLSTDQRGAPRPFDGDGEDGAACDIGAVEFGSPAPSFCGNTLIEAGEQCDDGNTANGDGCSSSCQKENQPPVARCHDVTVTTALNTCSVASASIDNGSSDPDGDPLTFTPTPAGPYALGSTTVTLTVSDGALSSQCTGTVTVVDGQAPAISCPSSQTTNATSATGATVNFTPTASDNCSATPPITCTPASGSTFAIGATTVSCTAKDDANNLSAPCTFTVTVTGAAGQLTTLLSIVNNLPGVKAATKNSLVVKLKAAQTALSAGDSATACAQVQDFLNLVKAQGGKKELSTAQATALSAEATRIRTVLGCA